MEIKEIFTKELIENAERSCSISNETGYSPSYRYFDFKLYDVPQIQELLQEVARVLYGLYYKDISLNIDNNEGIITISDADAYKANRQWHTRIHGIKMEQKDYEISKLKKEIENLKDIIKTLENSNK